MDFYFRLAADDVLLMGQFCLMGLFTEKKPRRLRGRGWTQVQPFVGTGPKPLRCTALSMTLLIAEIFFALQMVAPGKRSHS